MLHFQPIPTRRSKSAADRVRRVGPALRLPSTGSSHPINPCELVYLGFQPPDGDRLKPWGKRQRQFCRT